ncbi:unnamed protein product [Cylicocyclus nassatus]|uniref:ABC transporter domain-containing protein n=1 Tax=Cylicocyclus nassatus TaxID=53992 RepID=A0AA36MDB5_CYLNA|nr:unnamed protein product [Cylicocyclus nassatus]
MTMESATPLKPAAQRITKRERITVVWEDIKVRSTSGRQILKGISGVALPGEVVAVMGASASGKTVFLNALLHRNLHGLIVEGDVLVNGQRIGSTITSVSAYVEQEDIFVGTLTVREHLMVMARLKLPSTFRESTRAARVDQVIRDMLLENSQSSRIGVPGITKGISGGEMKRLAFASKMLSNPPLLLCDEPTTGLDSHMAESVVKRLESLSIEKEKTVICTINQPSSEVFELFHKVVFISQGRVAFHGTPDEAITFFAKCGYVMPDHTNPADHFIDILAIWPDKEEKCKEKVNEICEQFILSKYADRMLIQIDAGKQKRTLRPYQRPNFWKLLSGLFIRHVKDNIRNKSVMRAKFVQKAFMALFLGSLYFQTKPNQDGVSNLKGILFFFCSELSYPTIYGIQTYMPSEFPLVVREYHDGSYPVLAYYVAKVFSYIPIFSLDGTLMLTVAYWMIGLAPTFGRFLRNLITGALVETMAASLGVAVCSISPSYAVAVTITGPLLTIYSMTGGLFTNTAMIDGWIRWVQYLSWFRYGYEAFIINEWTYEKYENVSCTLTNGKPAESCERTGLEVIHNLNFNPSNIYFNWLCMLAFILAHYCIGYIALLTRVQKHR